MLQLLDVGSLMTGPDQARPAARLQLLPITSLGKDDAAISARASHNRTRNARKAVKKQDLESRLELAQQHIQPDESFPSVNSSADNSICSSLNQHVHFRTVKEGCNF